MLEEQPKIGDMSQVELEHYLADHTPPMKAGKHCWVYFIGCEKHGIKIGVATNVEKRLATLRSCCPISLKVMATRPGGIDRERAYHKQFAEHRLHGEWFDPHPDILAEIERLSD